MIEADLRALRARLQAARAVCVLTGAGMSAESGIATFRDAVHPMPVRPGAAAAGPAKAGLWARFDPEQLASEAGFRADPATAWAWYAERRVGVQRAEPHAGHKALGAYARRHPGRLVVVTQNVDDLHQRAGNTDAIRLHGDILADRWLAPCAHGPDCEGRPCIDDHPPRCGACGNLRRPGVVWFGEALPAGPLRAAEQAAGSCDVMLVVGTSGAVWPAAGLAGLARRGGAHVAIVNPHPSAIDDQAHACLRGTAATLLPALLEGL